MLSLLLALCLAPALGAERLQLRLGARDGVPVDQVHGVDFDDEGLLWAATSVGVYRHDGSRFLPAVPDDPPLPYFMLRRRVGGGVFAASRAGALYVIRDGERSPVELPGGLERIDDVETGADGALWIVGLPGRQVWRRALDGGWTRPLDGVLRPDERAYYLHDDREAITITTSDGALSASEAGIRRILETRDESVGLVAAVVVDEDSVVGLAFDGRLLRWDGASRALLKSPGMRGVQLGWRGETLWVSWDHGAGRLTDGEPLEWWEVTWGFDPVVSPDGAMTSGSPDGVVVWPEPETMRFTLEEGIVAPRFLRNRPGESRIWAGTWRHGLTIEGDRVTHLPDAPSRNGRPLAMRDTVCPDDAGRAWTVVRYEGQGESHVGSWGLGDPEVTLYDPVGGYGGSCALAADGAVWLAAGPALWKARGTSVRKVLDVDRVLSFVHEDIHGRLWAWRGLDLCRARVEPGHRAPLECLRVPEAAREVSDVVGLEDGTLLVATDSDGLYRWRQGRLERHPDSDSLGTRHISALARSPRGGVWVAGAGVLQRVHPDSLEHIEVLGTWAGVGRRSAGDIVEVPGGTVWLATIEGVVRVPPQARTAPRTPPPVRLVEARADGIRLTPGAPVRLASGSNALELHVAAVAYRDPGAVTYRLRVDDGVYRSAGDGRVQLLDLPSGEHELAIQASRDERRWSEPVVVQVHVEHAWYLRDEVLVLFAVLIGLLLFLAYRARVALLVARERERTRIAMDLHDELGSGLGSIRIIASVLDREHLPVDTRRELAARIRSTAGELHAGLQEIVGSLRPGGSTLGALVGRLTDRARDLFPGDDVQLHIVDIEPYAGVALSMPVRRELEHIGAEALHNAARHGHPGTVVLGAAPAGAVWRMWVQDDGAGFVLDPSASGGLGLESMRARAERIGAEVEIASVPGRGTTITVSFEPDARDRRKGRHR